MNLYARFTIRSFSTTTPEKERLVILGSGWAGYNLLTKVDPRKYKVTLVSPRNHFIFTPLLASTAVGTLDYSNITQPIRSHKTVEYHEASCEKIDLSQNQVSIKSVRGKGLVIPYDKLVIACGAKTQTFNTPGVAENAMFLREIPDAKKIRARILECFERAMEESDSNEQKGILHFAIVGGGPAGIEFAGELLDFIQRDLSRAFPSLKDKVTVTVYDVAPKILAMFVPKLNDYATDVLKKRSVDIRTGTIIEKITEKNIHIKGGQVVPYGLLLWSTGLAPNPLVFDLAVKKDKGNRIITNGQLRVLDDKGQAIKNVFALGDCATIENNNLPATGQVAKRKAQYLANALNKNTNEEYKDIDSGMMAYIGNWKAIAHLKFQGKEYLNTGILAWILWRSAYLAMIPRWKNKAMVLSHWFTTALFGRDLTK